MTPEQRDDERANLITLLVFLIVLPGIVGVITTSWLAVLIAGACTQGLIVVVAFWIVTTGEKVQR